MRIEITYTAILNRRKDHGYLPMVREDGRDTGSTWQAHGYDRDVALEIARKEAIELAGRFIGDYRPVVSEDRS